MSESPGSATPVDPRIADLDLLHFLLENIPDRIYFKDSRSRFIQASQALADFVRAENPGQLVGKTDFDFFTREHAARAFADEQELMRTGKPIVGKVEKETLPDGRIRWAITTKMPLRDTRGTIVGTCGISKDFTSQKALEDAVAERNEELSDRKEQLQRTLSELRTAHENLKEMQEQLIEAEKMQMVGRLAYGVAHEIRNPLNILHAGLDFFASERAVGEDATNAAILDEMRTAVRRADAVICALMDSSSNTGLNRAPAELRGAVERVLKGLEAELRDRKVDLVTEFADDLPPLRLDRPKVEQVFEGIFKNAMDAMSSGGRLVVRARLKRLTASEIEREAGLRSANRFLAGETVASIEIEDTGCGISPASLPKVFDPFFTTKETGSGTGLGLTVSRKIIQLHGGALLIGNREGGGVRVTMHLKVEPDGAQ